MALTQDELGNWYDDGSSGDIYDFGYGSGFGDTYDFWADIGINPDTTGEGGSFTPDSSWDGSSNIVGTLKDIANVAGKEGFNKLKQAFMKNGKVDWASLATAGIGLYSLNKGKDGGYNKPVPKMELTRQQVEYVPDPNRVPGSMGRQYFTDTRFTPKGDADALAAAQAASTAQAAGILAAAPRYAAPEPNPYAGKMKMAYNPSPVAAFQTPVAGLPAIQNAEQLTAEGGIKMARGGLADAGRYLRGKTDGMADEIETSIDEEQPALLSHGEFVIPADVVSHLGNGNSEAGAEKLYDMMDRIREARTGTKKQGKEIDPDKFLPAASGGLMAAYAGGGRVQRFNTGGTPNTPTPTTTGSGGVPQDVSRTSTLSPWVGDYVTDALSKGQALANAPYQAYKGPLTAGASDLQQQAFAGASEMAMAGYQPGKFVGAFNSPGGMGGMGSMPQQPQPMGNMSMNQGPKTEEDWNRFSSMAFFAPGTDMEKAKADFLAGGGGGSRQPQAMPQQNGIAGFEAPQASQQPSSFAQSYMNPYLQASLDPQLRELKRQSDIARLDDAARLTRAGAFGGSRQAIMESEGRRNLLDKQSSVLGQGYKTAFDTGMSQYNKDREAEEASRQFGANFGLKSVAQLADLGATQRGITSEGIAADKKAFEEERDFAYKMPQYQLGLLSGLPIGANTTSVNQDALSKMQSDISGLASLYKTLSGLIPKR
jgi:hypothetical protein